MGAHTVGCSHGRVHTGGRVRTGGCSRRVRLGECSHGRVRTGGCSHARVLTGGCSHAKAKKGRVLTSGAHGWAGADVGGGCADVGVGCADVGWWLCCDVGCGCAEHSHSPTSARQHSQSGGWLCAARVDHTPMQNLHARVPTPVRRPTTHRQAGRRHTPTQAGGQATPTHDGS